MGHASTQTLPLKLYTGRKIAQLCAANNKIFGLLARGVPSTINTATINTSNLKGQYGENVIGSMLNIKALEHEELYVFHSVLPPKGMAGETDHVVLYKNKLILIETKTYSNFRVFTVSKEGELRGRKNGEKNTLRRLDNNNLIQKVREYEKLFPEYSVHAITAVTRSDVDTKSENGKYKVASLANIFQNLDYHISAATDISAEINEESISYLAANCLKQ